jgi:TATA-box binding protein (TBP) (component of TFIID and TFIIIB)
MDPITPAAQRKRKRGETEGNTNKQTTEPITRVDGVVPTVVDAGLRVENMCATANFYPLQMLDLFRVAMVFKDVELNPNFAAVIFRIRDEVERCVVVLLVFRSGKVNIVGARSRARCVFWLRKLRAELTTKLNIGYEKPFCTTVSMMTCSSTLPGCLDVRAFYNHNLPQSCWEPELYPGLKWTPFTDPLRKKITILAFQSTRFVVTGAKNIEDCHIAALMFHKEGTNYLLGK